MVRQEAYADATWSAQADCVSSAFMGRSVSGTCRPGQLDKQQLLESRGVTVHDFDPDNLKCLRYVNRNVDAARQIIPLTTTPACCSSNAGIEQLQQATCILTTVPPKGDFDQDPVS